jgi:hypothetical protein
MAAQNYFLFHGKTNCLCNCEHRENFLAAVNACFEVRLTKGFRPGGLQYYQVAESKVDTRFSKADSVLAARNFPDT